MASVLFADISETAPIWKRAVGDSEVEIQHLGPYVELRFPDGITIVDIASKSFRAIVH